MNPAHVIGSILPTIFITSHLAIQIWGTLRLRTVREKIGGSIKSVADLALVRFAIQTNLRLGVILMCNLIPLLISLCLIRGGLAIYIAVLAIGQTVLWFTLRPVEKQFKAMPIAADDEDLAIEYRSYVEQWSGLHLSLRPPGRTKRENKTA
jgi:hypothetical protein